MQTPLFSFFFFFGFARQHPHLARSTGFIDNVCLLSSFYYVDERTENGQSVMSAIDGRAHGEFCFELARSEGQGPWDATFVKGIGYRDFESVTTRL